VYHRCFQLTHGFASIDPFYYFRSAEVRSIDGLPACHFDERPAHITRGVRRQEQDNIRNFLGLRNLAKWHRFVEVGNGRVRVEATHLEAGPQHRYVDLQRADRVHMNLLMGMVASQALGQRGDGGLLGAIKRLRRARMDAPAG